MIQGLTLVLQGKPTCVVEWDDGNVVATQLEGSWVINKELSLVLSPWSDTVNIDKLK